MLERGLARAERQGTVLALIFVDIDDFKSINDQYSHHAGDAVLREVARRLEAASRRADVVARVGGDEFVVVYEPTGNGHDNFLARIERALAPPIEVAPSTVLHCTASLGRVDTLTCPATATALLAAADAAMYQAKRAHHAAARSAAE